MFYHKKVKPKTISWKCNFEIIQKRRLLYQDLIISHWILIQQLLSIDCVHQWEYEVNLKYTPWSFLAVKIINPVSSPTKHSAIRIWRTWGASARPFCNTILVLTTFTVRVCPEVLGRSWATLVNTGFLNPGFDSAISAKPCEIHTHERSIIKTTHTEFNKHSCAHAIIFFSQCGP